MEQPKQLEITEYQLEEVRIERNPEYSSASLELGRVGVSVDWNVFTNKDEVNRFAVGLIIKTCDPTAPGASCPLKIVVRMVGFFTVSEPLSDGKVPFQITVNGLTILYGIARGLVGTAAAWFGGNTVVLPTQYFSERLRAKELANTRTEQKALEVPTIAIAD